MVKIDILMDLNKWKVASEEQQNGIINHLLSKLEKEFELSYIKSYGKKGDTTRIATFKQKATGILFNLIPGGKFQMGFSTSEEQALRQIKPKDSGLGGGSFTLKDKNGKEIESGTIEPNIEQEFIEEYLENVESMQPVHEVILAPFLILRFPIMLDEVKKLITIDEEGNRLETGQAALFFDEIDELLEKTGCSLPSEAQWEYSCRGGTKTIFFWGNTIPDGSEWIGTYDDDKKNEEYSNGFGLVDMGAFSEVCDDKWHPNYKNAPIDGSSWSGDSQNQIVRGGAANIYPWQDCGEWLLMISANRGTDVEWEYGFNIRLVKNLNDIL
ncbi:MAG: SUMF1/EgtB/PvdO family nonheme iron enzyme [Candidatus Helarchaeota archaeon]|nr:SUMF1/EgtB/PvdO family nonheme iron enzyme [Candidatus Helarchaeota archaeon]